MIAFFKNQLESHQENLNEAKDYQDKIRQIMEKILTRLLALLLERVSDMRRPLASNNDAVAQMPYTAGRYIYFHDPVGKNLRNKIV